jgi:hypothetical protein
LFNCIIDEALDSLNPRIGFKVQDKIISSLAFADDLVLIAQSASSCEVQLQTMMSVLNTSDLSLNPSKCASLSILINGKKKKWFVDSREIRVGDEFIPVMNLTTKFDNCSSQTPTKNLYSPSTHSPRTHPPTNFRTRQQDFSP